MKFFGRKKNRSQAGRSTPFVSEEDNSFYDPQPTESPLTIPSSRSGPRGHRSTSLDSPARRRENPNRTTDRGLLVLMLKIVLIPVLIVVGFLGLKAVVGLFDEPSEKEIQKSETRAELMDKVPSSGTALSVESAGGLSVNRDFLADRMTRWTKAERHLRAAEALHLQGINDKAIVRLKQVLQFAPESRDAQQQLLKLYMDSGNYAEAIPLCIRLLDQDSTQWDLKVSLLLALQEEQKNELCVFWSDQLLLEQPRDINLLEIAAYSHVAAGDLDKSIEYYKQILEEKPNNLLALVGLGYIYQLQKEWLKAVPYYLKLLELNPKEQHYLALARSYSQLGDSGKALIFLGQAFGLYGESVVSTWLSDPDFDPVRDTVDFRSFGNMVVGEKRFNAIEEIRRRETRPETLEDALKTGRSARKDLNLLKPSLNQEYKLR